MSEFVYAILYYDGELRIQGIYSTLREAQKQPRDSWETYIVEWRIVR